MTNINFKTRPCKGPDAPTVQDVIDAFMKVEDKTLPVFGWLEETEPEKGDSIDIIRFTNIDISMEDRIDVNLILSD